MLSLVSASHSPLHHGAWFGRRAGTAEARVAGREAKVLWFARWASTRLGYVGLDERRPVFFSWLLLPLLCPTGLSTVLPFFHP